MSRKEDAFLEHPYPYRYQVSWMRYYGGQSPAYLLASVLAETETMDPDVEAPVKEKPKEEEKEGIKDIEKRARKPPSEGPCLGCGNNLPLNRLELCFRCWVNKNLDDWAKSQGRDFIPTVDAHPAWCGCGLPEHGGDKGRG